MAVLAEIFRSIPYCKLKLHRISVKVKKLNVCKWRVFAVSHIFELDVHLVLLSITTT